MSKIYNMKGTHLGELEEIALLVVANLFDNAYGVAVKLEIEEKAGRKITISTVHTSLHRLEEKGFVKSEVGGTTKARGGRRKRLYRISETGYQALDDARSLRNKMWQLMPKLDFKTNS